VTLAVLVTVALLPAASDAEGFVYWANQNSGSIGRANNNGTGAIQNLVTGLSGPCGVAVNDTHIYWAEQSGDRIGRANLDGSGRQILVAPVDEPCGVALDAGFVYWGALGGNIGRANLDGTSPNGGFTGAATTTPCGVAVDDDFIYWASFGGPDQSVARAEIDGSNPNALFIGGAVKPCGVAVNSTHVFWANFDAGSGDTIGRADLDGTNPDQSFIAGLNAPCGLALDDSGHIFWASQSSTTIGRADIDGGNVTGGFIGSASGPCGVAVDDKALPTCGPVTASTTLDKPVTINLAPGCSGQGPLTYATVSSPAEGLLKDLDPVAGTVRYVPVGGFKGQDGFGYRGSNVSGGSDSTVTVQVLPPPNGFTFKVKRNRRRGTASLKVEVPVGGRLQLAGAGVRGLGLETIEAGRVALPVRPTGKLKRRLAKRGFATARFNLTFTPIDGNARTEQGSVALVERRCGRCAGSPG
jgi:hypothetical protein